MTFGSKLKKLRTDNKLTQEELAEKIHVTRTAISKWETDRGYPSIDSLKEIARFYSVTVDQLLSSDEVLQIAEADNKKRENRFCSKVNALLDLSMGLLLFLPFFANTAYGKIESVSLLALGGVQPYLKISYLAVVITMMLTGAFQLVFSEFKRALVLKISLFWGVVSALLFIISLQPYAALFAFTTLIIKVLILILKGELKDE